MPRPLRRFPLILPGLVALAGLAGLLAGPAAVAADGEPPGIDVVQVDGLLDPPNVSLVLDAIEGANDRGSTLLVLQVDSGGGLDGDIDEVVDAVEASAVPVAVWVGPSGATARGTAAVLLQAAHVASVSSGSSVGPAHPLRLDRPGAVSPEDVADRLAALAGSRGRDPDGARRTATDRLGADRAVEVGAVDGSHPILGDLIVSLDGEEVETAAGTVVLSTAEVVGEGAERRRTTNQDVRFRRLGLGGQVVHTLSSPAVAYLLFVAGLCLVVFEFFTASIGLAGLAGAGALVGSLVGFSHLPVQWWAAALVVAGILGFAVDVQAGTLGFWTGFGTAALVAGSFTLYGGSSRLDPSWWVVVLVCLGTVVFMVGGMTAMIRARFSTPTVGREGMVGEMGEAEVDVAPDGVVRVRGALWRARTNRATPIRAGDRVRVVEVVGLVLEVEPEEGGARESRH